MACAPGTALAAAAGCFDISHLDAMKRLISCFRLTILLRPARIAATFVLASLLIGTAWAHNTGPSVVASIKPVHSLVAAVMQGIAQPELLIPGTASPHTYALRPSDAQTLSHADLLFWIGPGLETFLEKPLQTLASSAEAVALIEAPGVHTLPVRRGGAFEAHHHEHEHEHTNVDMHIWLDPENARAMVRTIAERLSQRDPDHATQYQANARHLDKLLQNLEQELQHTLAPVRQQPLVVFHDAYQYLEHRFGLHVVGAITVSPDVMPGAARVAQIRERIAAAGSACVFAEPQFQPRIVQTVVSGTGAHTGTLDPLGADLPAGPDHYGAMLRANAQAIRNCISAATGP